MIVELRLGLQPSYHVDVNGEPDSDPISLHVWDGHFVDAFIEAVIAWYDEERLQLPRSGDVRLLLRQEIRHAWWAVVTHHTPEGELYEEYVPVVHEHPSARPVTTVNIGQIAGLFVDMRADLLNEPATRRLVARPRWPWAR